MLIANKKELFEAIDNHETLVLNNQGELYTQGWGEYASDLVYYTLGTSEFIQTKKSDLQIAMAELITEEDIHHSGPKNLQESQRLYGRSLDEITKNAQKIITTSFIEYTVQQELKEEPKSIQNGAGVYVNAIGQRKYPEGNTDFDLLKSFVHGELQSLQSRPGCLLGQIACGYSLSPNALGDHMAYLQENLKVAIKETWNEKYLNDFDENGIYTIFVRDAGRDRPSIQNNRYKLEDYDHKTATENYCQAIKNEFPEKSMAAVVTVLMSQTCLPVVAEMVSGVGTQHPLNPYTGINNLDIPEIMAIVGTTTKGTRRVLTHGENTNGEQRITIGYNFPIDLKDMNTGNSQNVGGFSFIIQMNKNQFPLTPGAEPEIEVIDMRVDRQIGFKG